MELQQLVTNLLATGRLDRAVASNALPGTVAVAVLAAHVTSLSMDGGCVRSGTQAPAERQRGFAMLRSVLRGAADATVAALAQVRSHAAQHSTVHRSGCSGSMQHSIAQHNTAQHSTGEVACSRVHGT